MAKTTYSVICLGAKFEGRCVKCKQPTGKRSFELADTILLRGPDGYAVAHPMCVGITTKSAVGGGRKIRGALPETISA